MYYIPNPFELDRLKQSDVSAEVLEVLSGTFPKLLVACPITDKTQARKYLKSKIERYKGGLKYAGSVDVVEDRYVAEAMGILQASGFTYINLYAHNQVFLTEPHVAAALAFNALNHIDDVPDNIDEEYGLDYEKEVLA